MREPCDIPGLRRWLYAATGDLCEDAAARVYEEIRAHFADAVEAHMAGGLPRDEAERLALAGLGPPYRAAKAFRRTYLTKDQDDWLAWMKAPWRKPGRLLRFAGGTILMLAFRVLLGHAGPGDLVMVTSVAITCWMLLIQCGLVPYLFRQGHPRRAVAWAALNFPLALAVGLGIVGVHSPLEEVIPDLPATFGLLALVLIFCIVFVAPLWRKTSRDGNPTVRGNEGRHA